MATLHLCGNHQPCPDCGGTGRGAVSMWEGEFVMQSRVTGRRYSWPRKNVHAACRTCTGSGRVLRPLEAIVADLLPTEASQ